jgi:hypothetical protein
MFLRIFGAILTLLGLVLSFNPNLISSSHLPQDAYQAIEGRIKWGVVLGFGLFFLLHHRFVPWLPTISALVCALAMGVLLTRLIGIAQEGHFVKQWMWAGIELFVVLFFGYIYIKQRSKIYN